MNALQAPQYAPVAEVDVAAQVSELVNQLFHRLCTYCNRWRYNFPTDEALEEAKFVWIEELINHDILTVAQLEQGLVRVRAARSDYFPNLFEFIGWCKLPANFPSEGEITQRLAQFQRFGMTEVDHFPFRSTAEYWLITDLYARCRRFAWSNEQIKKEIGSAFPEGQVREIEVKGRNLSEGIPRAFRISSNEIREALTPQFNHIVSAVKIALEDVPPEIGADISERGIMLTGGGAMIPGLDRLLAEETGLPTLISDEPLTCVVRGCGLALERMDELGGIFTHE